MYAQVEKRKKISRTITDSRELNKIKPESKKSLHNNKFIKDVKSGSTIQRAIGQTNGVRDASIVPYNVHGNPILAAILFGFAVNDDIGVLRESAAQTFGTAVNNVVITDNFDNILVDNQALVNGSQYRVIIPADASVVNPKNLGKSQKEKDEDNAREQRNAPGRQNFYSGFTAAKLL